MSGKFLKLGTLAAGDVENPRRNFPRSLFMATALVGLLLALFLPLLLLLTKREISAERL